MTLVTRMAAATILALWSVITAGQTCPASSGKLKATQDAISDLQKNGRAPAGADCAHEVATNYTFGPRITKEDIDFFNIAADVQRRAAEKRSAANQTTQADAYLNQEIEVRRKFLDEALRESDAGGDEPTKRAVVRHLSSLIGAMALRRDFEKAAEYLGQRKDPTLIDDEALKVWLQGIWSCAKWDGNKRNVCAPATREQCRNKIAVFLDSVSNMKGRTFAPESKVEIQQLKQLSTGTCLQ